MDKFTDRVLNFIHKTGMLARGDKVVVGFSGGADSTALLTVLSELEGVLGIGLYALHLNHGIREEAGEDEAFCRQFCAERGITFKSVSRDIPQMARVLSLTEEEAGRIARYQAFDDYCRELGAGRIAVAHHMDDAAETLLMNLSRGSGLKGAGGIRPVRDNVIRPLLCVTRAEIEQYLGKRAIDFCTDRTNLENEYTRNYIRNEVMPALTEHVNSRAAYHMALAASSFDRADEFIRSYAEDALDKSLRMSEGRALIPAAAILSEKEIIRETMVLLIFERLVPGRKDIGHAHVEAVLSLLEAADGEASADLPYGLRAIRRYRELEIGPAKHRDDEPLEIAAQLQPGMETEVFVPGLGRAEMAVFPYDKEKSLPVETYTKWLDYDRIQEVLFRKRRPGDEIAIDGEGRIFKKSLNKFMTDVKIPKSRRDEMYILADGSSIVWVPGYRIGADYKVSDATKTILEINIINGGIYNG